VTTALSAAFTPATLDYVALLPVLIIFSAAMLGVLVEAFVPRTSRYLAQVTITLVGIVAAMAALAFGAVTLPTSIGSNRSALREKPSGSRVVA